MCHLWKIAAASGVVLVSQLLQAIGVIDGMRER